MWTNDPNGLIHHNGLYRLYLNRLLTRTGKKAFNRN